MAPRLVAWLVVALVPACALGCSRDAEEAEPPTTVVPNRHGVVAGLAVEIPGGWQLRRRGEGFVTPAFCFEVSSRHREGVVRFAASRVGPDEAEVRVVELSETGRIGGVAPARFSLAHLSPPGAVQWTNGGLFAFSTRMRTIYVGVLLGPNVSAATKRHVTALVRSLSVRDESARC